MTKVSVTGPKKHLETTIDRLHELGVLDIDDYDGELETGNPLPEAEHLSDLLVDVRSLISKLPETSSERNEFSLERIQDRVPDLAEKTDELISEREGMKRSLSNLEDEREFYERLEGIDLKYEDLEGSKTLEVFIGTVDESKLEGEYEIYRGESADAIVYRKDSGFESELADARRREFSLPDTERKGSVEKIIGDIDQECAELESEIERLDGELQKISDEWKPRLEKVEEYLSERIEKAEAPLSFATTKRAFIVEGWMPSEVYPQFEENIASATGGKVHIQREEGDNPPVKHDNNRVVQPFESLTDLVSIPKYNELDPSFMIFLTFPLLFGFMIGDAGYGLTTLIVFYLGYRMFPGAKDIFKSLMYASVATIAFGLAFGDAFGYVLFGSHSDLAHATGIHLFEQIPILFHRAEHLGQVFQISALIGLIHVNAGYLLGAYNEYARHSLKEAFLEKGSWLMIELGFGLWYFVGMTAGAPVVALGVIALYVGEGVEGVVEIPSLLSNILSYLRIFGVAVAAVSLAAVVNSMAEPLFAMGGITGIVLGVTVLALGHTFNTFIKIMEGFLQGIRLHYVELFDKFYEGGGRKYSPFGQKNSI